MDNTVKEGLWTQFGASIDMLKNAIERWPGEKWETHPKFFYIAYHTLVFLDHYLTHPPGKFRSPLPFTLTEPADVPPEALDDVVPDRIYTKKELMNYLHECREKCRQLIAALTAEKLKERWIGEGGHMNYSLMEILLYNMRHVQHHAAQLNLFLRRELNEAPGWVGRAKDHL